MAFGEEKRKRKNIKLVKTRDSEEDWATRPPDAEEVEELLSDLDDVLNVTSGVPKEKKKRDDKFFLGCAPSVRVTEEDLKEALKAMSTPVGEAPKGLGGTVLVDTKTAERDESAKAFIPPAIRPNYRMAQKISVVAGLFFLCLMLFSYFSFSSFLKVTVKHLESRWAAHAVELKKGELRNFLFSVAGALKPERQRRAKKTLSPEKKLYLVVSPVPAIKKKENLLVMWSKGRAGKLKVTETVPDVGVKVSTTAKLVNILGLAPEEEKKFAGELSRALGRVSVEGHSGYDEGFFSADNGKRFIVFALKNIPDSGRILGYFGTADTAVAQETIKTVTGEIRNISHLVLGVELAVFFIIVLYLFFYNWKRNNEVYRLGHHIDLMALGDLEQEISVSTGDDIDFLAQKIAAMQTSFLGAISRLRRRRNI